MGSLYMWLMKMMIQRIFYVHSKHQIGVDISKNKKHKTIIHVSILLYFDTVIIIKVSCHFIELSFTIIAWLKIMFIYSNNCIWLLIQNLLIMIFWWRGKLHTSSIIFELSTSQLINKYILIKVVVFQVSKLSKNLVYLFFFLANYSCFTKRKLCNVSIATTYSSM